MKFLVIFFFAATMMTATVWSQNTTAIDYLISEIEDELDDYSTSPTSPTSPSTSSYSSYSSPSSYSDYDDTTTTKPFKQQLLSLFFNKKAG